MVTKGDRRKNYRLFYKILLNSLNHLFIYYYKIVLDCFIDYIKKNILPAIYYLNDIFYFTFLKLSAILLP
ncbi:hypothetical protein ScFU6_00300 [Streptococcus canis]|nr:hypothetical protein ScFU6_00300 [Streptococcus canis]GFG42892.1 hypothetical protein ScFU29_17960 [Streptococcus canis]